MLRELRDKRGLDLDRVSKVDVIHGRMIVEYRDGDVAVDEPVKDFHGAALKGCDECADFLGRGADLSVGSVGSMAGWSSVLVRTEAGRLAFERARGRLDVRDLDDPEALLQARQPGQADRGADPAAQARPRRARCSSTSPSTSSSYSGTDRAPVVERRRSQRLSSVEPAEGLRLEHPDEPVEMRVGAARRPPGRGRLARGLQPTTSASASWLWERWRPALEPAGMDREAFVDVVIGYGRELWLWLMGERQWDEFVVGPGRTGGPAPARPLSRRPATGWRPRRAVRD